MNNKIIITILSGFVLALGFLWFMNSQKQTEVPKRDTGTVVGKSVTSFTLMDLEGESITVQGNDKITIINFWATWCPPCQAEMPEINQFVLKNKEISFFAVNIQESRDKVQEFMQKNQYTMQVLLDKDGTVAKTYRVNAIPTTLIVDRNGVIKYRKSGGVTLGELEGIVRGL